MTKNEIWNSLDGRMSGSFNGTKFAGRVSSAHWAEFGLSHEFEITVTLDADMIDIHDGETKIMFWDTDFDLDVMENVIICHNNA
jgi:hypothetical protein